MKILKEKYNYQPINRDSIEGKRLYACPDGVWVPSVTTILSATQSEEKVASLQKWRDYVGKDKAQAITTEAANRGTRMHKYLEDYAINGQLTPHGTNPFSRQSYLMAETIVNYGMINVSEVWGSEIGLYYPGLYAGTADAIGLHNNEGAIFDYKQSNKPKKREYISDYFLQLVAYSLAHNKIYNTKYETIPFSDRQDADQFQAKYGGLIRSMHEITEQLEEIDYDTDEWLEFDNLDCCVGRVDGEDGYWYDGEFIKTDKKPRPVDWDIPRNPKTVASRTHFVCYFQEQAKAT